MQSRRSDTPYSVLGRWTDATREGYSTSHDVTISRGDVVLSFDWILITALYLLDTHNVIAVAIVRLETQDLLVLGRK